MSLCTIYFKQNTNDTIDTYSKAYRNVETVSFFGSCGRATNSCQRNSPYMQFKPKESWTHIFVCLSDIEEDQIPSRERKQVLKEGGLGEKKLIFSDKNGSFQHVKTTLEKDLKGHLRFLGQVGLDECCKSSLFLLQDTLCPH